MIDGYTCSGGTAALDMMLQVFTDRDGRELANDVSEQFIHPRIRGTQDSSPSHFYLKVRIETDSKFNATTRRPERRNMRCTAALPFVPSGRRTPFIHFTPPGERT